MVVTSSSILYDYNRAYKTTTTETNKIRSLQSGATDVPISQESSKFLLAEKLTTEKELTIESLDGTKKVFSTGVIFKSQQLETDQNPAPSNTQNVGDLRITEKTTQVQEKVHFYTNGIIKTNNGNMIKFDFTLDFASFFSRSNMSQSNFIDPLIINLNTPSAALSTENFDFDIDADGRTDRVTDIGYGSGYLVLDKNEDGIINDGREMFGATTGDGFAELARYDEDKNGWIDENDEVFEKLQVWSVQKDGSKKLLGLLDAGVGAIYINSGKSDFFHRDVAVDGALGKTTNTGIFLNTDGTNIGTVQQMNLQKRNTDNDSRQLLSVTDNVDLTYLLQNMNFTNNETDEDNSLLVIERGSGNDFRLLDERSKEEIVATLFDDEMNANAIINEAMRFTEEDIAKKLNEIEDVNIITLLRIVD